MAGLLLPRPANTESTVSLPLSSWLHLVMLARQAQRMNTVSTTARQMISLWKVSRNSFLHRIRMLVRFPVRKSLPSSHRTINNVFTCHSQNSHNRNQVALNVQSDLMEKFTAGLVCRHREIWILS